MENKKKIEEIEKQSDAYLEIEDHFDKVCEKFNQKGHSLISLDEIAKLGLIPKMQEDGRFGTWLKDGAIYFLKDRELEALITSDSPVMKYAKDAAYAHECGKEFYKNEQTKKAFDEGVKNAHLKVRDINEKAFSTEKLGEYEEMKGLFGKNTAKYGKLLHENGIKTIFLRLQDRYYGKKTEGVFANQLWFGPHFEKITDKNKNTIYNVDNSKYQIIGEGLLSFDGNAIGINKNLREQLN